MGFLNPHLLPLASLAAIPVLIHLISRLRLRQAQFPSLILLQTVRRDRFSWLRLKELLLLVVRTLALLALLLALARPYLRRTVPGLGSAQDLIVVLDDSYSMAYGSRWNRARQAAHAFLSSLAKGQRVQVLTSSQPESTLSSPGTTIPLLHAWLDSLRPSYSSRTLEPAIRRASQLAQAATAAVVVITDLQERALPPDLTVPKGATITLVDVAAPDFDNAGVVALRPDNPISPRQLTATFVNYGPRPVTRVAAFQADSAAAERMVVLGPGSRTQITFAVPSGNAPIPVQVQLRSDSLMPDNSRYGLVAPHKPTPVLVVQSAEAITNFLADALGPDSTAQFRLTVIDPHQLRATDLRRYPVVIVTDASRITPADWDRLDFYLRTGGAALVLTGALPGPGSGLERYARVLGTVLPAGFVSIVDLDTTHPALDILRPGDLAPARFFTHVRLAPVAGRVLARLADQDPFIIETANGRLHIWAVTLLPSATDLMFKAAFVPLLHRTLSYLAATNLRTDYLIGDTIRVMLDQAGPLMVTTPGGNYSLTADVALGRPRAIFTATRVPGSYRFGANGPVVVVNVDPAEGDLTRADPARLRTQGFKLQTPGFKNETAGLAPLLLYLAAAAFAAEMIVLAL